MNNSSSPGTSERSFFDSSAKRTFPDGRSGSVSREAARDPSLLQLGNGLITCLQNQTLSVSERCHFDPLPVVSGWKDFETHHGPASIRRRIPLQALLCPKTCCQVIALVFAERIDVGRRNLTTSPPETGFVVLETNEFC
jgi:hypothetical protein